MILKYTTGKLPPNFFMLGVILLLIGILAIIMSEFAGIVAILLSIPLLFIRTGILIDNKKKRIKKYIGLFAYKTGKWESIAQIHHLQIIRVRQTTGMAVLSITRNETNIVYKLLAVLPNENIELLSGEGRFIGEAASDISSQLNTEVLEPASGIMQK
ncbi:hypothetical protein GQR60_17945 [Labilibaculum sp. A4]|uniref:hypothetical protein n=1 Tax=Labilibaculum euxinus TaxID=2686357 RepID=UPI000F61A97F|nr:hypothetical protein [Labilibaculum euxinus]MDQ1772494.1 hypothetical protein [Labilibaculum euxinus]MWN78221.1 hypothetical protein [Labilibaculum euxinus]